MTLLSHYTSPKGLAGIAQSGVLWATRFLNLNDTKEYFYAWNLLLLGVRDTFLARIPEDRRPTAEAFDDMLLSVGTQFRDALTVRDGLGDLYITSFARSTTEDHQNRGIFTVWERYTSHRGYCLQFDQSDIERMLYLEQMRSSYSEIGLIPVTYGVDRTCRTYTDLSFQLSEYFLAELLRHRLLVDVEPNHERRWAPSHLLREIMKFCARHKDPCFEDEREIRIFAYPADRSVARVFTGIAGVKELHKGPEGKTYIKLGEHWRPGISPARIIVGTFAEPNIEASLSLLPRRPILLHADFPLNPQAQAGEVSSRA